MLTCHLPAEALPQLPGVRLRTALLRTLGVGAIFSISIPALQAQPQIETIAVTGNRSSERTVLQATVPVDILTEQALRNSGALAGELGEALATLVPVHNMVLMRWQESSIYC